MTGRVAFVSDRNLQRAIYIMHPDGSNQQAVYSLATGTRCEIALSADGSRIAFIASTAGQTAHPEHRGRRLRAHANRRTSGSSSERGVVA